MTCSFLGCDRPRHGRLDLCRGHYLQRYRGQTLKPLRARAIRPCAFDGCDRQIRSNGLCAAHLAQRSRGKPLHPLRETQTRCGCPWPEEGRFCPGHRAMFWEQTYRHVEERLRA